MPNVLAEPYDAANDESDGPEASDLLKDAQEAFTLIRSVEQDNRDDYRDDIEFARLSQQWPGDIARERQEQRRPALTSNLLPAFIRQVVNDARQNKPQISVHPVDSQGDPHTADVMAGLIRNIESESNADVAYDTALETAASGGWGYVTVSTEYASDDSFDFDLRINAVADPLTIYGDPFSTAADSSDWNSAFETTLMDRDLFKRQFQDASTVDWTTYDMLDMPWTAESGNKILLAKWWRREPVTRAILKLAAGDTTTVVSKAIYEERRDVYDMVGFEVVGTRDVPSHKVTMTLLSGAEVLEERGWGGKYIPIVPVYCDVVVLEGKRYLRSMIRDAKDPLRMKNYWDTMATETVALSPKSPFVGPENAFDVDRAKWETANTVAHPYLRYKGNIPPQRQAAPPVPAGALQMAADSADSIRRIIGIHDENLGVSGDATSGSMLLAQQRKGETSHFHIRDNLNRAVGQVGRILIDLIPSVYPDERIARIRGEDGKPRTVTVNGPSQEPQTGPDGKPMVDPATQQAMMVTRLYDLSAGRYDLTVRAGPSLGTQREEQARMLLEIVRADPQLAPIIVPQIARSLDFHGADEMSAQIDQQRQGAQNADAQKAQAELQKQQMQMQADAAQAQQEFALERERMQAEAQIKITTAQQQAQATLEIERAKLEQKAQLAQAEAQFKASQAAQEAAFEQDLAQRKLQADIEIQAMRAAASVQPKPVTDGVSPGGEPG